MQMDRVGMRRADCKRFLRLNTIPPDGSESTMLVCGSCFSSGGEEWCWRPSFLSGSIKGNPPFRFCLRAYGRVSDDLGKGECGLGGFEAIAVYRDRRVR